VGKGGGSTGTTTAYQTNIPRWAEGAHLRMIEEAEGLTYGDEGGFARLAPEERIEGFNQNELSAMDAAQQMFNRGDPYADFAGEQLGLASGIPDRFRDISSGYQSRGFDFGESDPQFDFGQVGSTYNPSTFDFGTYNGPRYGASEFDFGTVTPGYESQDFDFGKFTDEGVAESYMSPYMQNVVEAEMATARKEFERQGMQSDAERVASGSRGGYREALQQAIERPEQGRQIAEIQQRGLQRSYEDATRAFEADRQAAIHAARMGDQSALQEAQLRMRGSEGDRDAAIQAAQMGELSKWQESQMGLDIYGQDRAAAIQAAQMGEAGAVTSAEMQQRAGEMDRSTAIRAAEMNQESYQQNRLAMIRAEEMGDRSAVQAAQMRMQADMENQNNLIQQMESLQGLARTGMDIGTVGQTRALERMAALESAGVKQRGMGQARRDLENEYFTAERDWPWFQMGRMGSVLAGLPQNMVQSTTSQGPSLPSELLGLGLGGYGLQKFLNS